MTTPKTVDRATPQQRNIEVHLVAEKILDGVPRKTIEEYIINELGRSKRVAENYFTDATKVINHMFEERFEGKMPSIAASFQTVYNKALEAGDFRAANDAMKNLAMLLGMMKTKVESKTEITTNGELREVATDELIRIAQQGG